MNNAPELRMLKLKLNTRSAAMGMAAQLRLIAELLESGEMESSAGGIKVHSNFSGEVTIESDLVLATLTQPKVEDPTEEVPQIDLFTCLEEEVQQSLQKMEYDQVGCLSFDIGEEDQARDWAAIIRNKGRYPLTLDGRTFDVKLTRSATEITLMIKRLT